jgi:hypothetical protein|tara:strand:+ start:2356 stop:3060 length:705 start_codon:yes stop_codon:yes gene_type:complete
MTADIGWCWTGTVPELLVIEPERFKTPKIVNKDYNKRGVIDCPSYQGFYSNLFLLKSPVSFTATPKEGAVDISSDEVNTNQLQGLVTLHQPQEMHDIKKPMFQFNLNYLFIADEPCLMEILPPFMHKDKFPGEVIGGSYNIHSWVRSISWGFVFNDIKKPLVVKRGDPLCYVKFTTPDLKSKVTLKECLLTDDIIRELDRKRFLTEFKKGGIINLMSRALKLRPKKLIKRKPRL